MTFQKILHSNKWLFLLKTAIVALAAYFVFEKLQHLTFRSPHVTTKAFLLLIFLSFSNWFLEIKKWQLLTNHLQKTNFKTASKQHFISQVIGFITPNKIGEYGIKGIFFNKVDRPKIWTYNFIGNAHQMSATVFFGILGLSYSSFQFIEWETLLLVSVATIGLMFFLSLRFRKNKFVKIFTDTSKKLHLNLSLLSFSRYLIFSFQFYLLLKIFDITLTPLLLFTNIWLYYFISSCVPNFVLTDIIVKSSVAIGLFGIYEIEPTKIISTTTIMWLLNFVTPAAIGAVLLLKLKKPVNGIVFN